MTALVTGRDPALCSSAQGYRSSGRTSEARRPGNCEFGSSEISDNGPLSPSLCAETVEPFEDHVQWKPAWYALRIRRYDPRGPAVPGLHFGLAPGGGDWLATISPACKA